MVKESDVINFVNFHNIEFQVWQAGPNRVQIKLASGEKTMQFTSLKTTLQYANLVGKTARRETFAFGD